MSTADSPPTHPGDLPCAASTKMSKTLSAILSQRVCISSCSLCEGVRDEGVRVCRSRGYMYVKVHSELTISLVAELVSWQLG